MQNLHLNYNDSPGRHPNSTDKKRSAFANDDVNQLLKMAVCIIIIRFSGIATDLRWRDTRESSKDQAKIFSDHANEIVAGEVFVLSANLLITSHSLQFGQENKTDTGTGQ